jgi:carbon storage regulator CsrA
MGMVITRRPGEAVRVGDALVKIVRLSNGKVKLSIDAPAEVRIMPVLENPKHEIRNTKSETNSKPE